MPTDDTDCIAYGAAPIDIDAEVAARALHSPARSAEAEATGRPHGLLLLLLMPLYALLGAVCGPEAVLAVFGAVALFAITIGIAVRVWFERPRGE